MSVDPARGAVVGAHADLDLLFAEIAALRKLAADPEQARDPARVYDFSIRWGAMVSGRLPRLAHYHGRGELTADEHARYEQLRAALREVLPLAGRLGIARPTLADDDEPG